MPKASQELRTERLYIYVRSLSELTGQWGQPLIVCLVTESYRVFRNFANGLNFTCPISSDREKKTWLRLQALALN